MGHLLEAVVSKKAKLVHNFEPDLPKFEGDAAQIRQVLMNLITNASDALGDSSGTITITTGLMEASASDLANTVMDMNLRAGPYVYVEVSDTGCGMDAQIQKSIFDPFYTTKFTGRGLGLAATLGIIRGHKGAIKVESEVGKGTSIRVLIPAATHLRDEAPIVQAVDADDWCGQGLVLVVDDERFVREAAKSVLEEIGFDVLVAEDGHQAMELTSQHGADICAVLLDMTMPHMSGEETLTALRNIREDIPVLLSSGYSEQLVQNRFADKSISGFIKKPYTPQKLASVLRGILEG